jgi:signal transduction histidine kinase
MDPGGRRAIIDAPPPSACEELVSNATAPRHARARRAPSPESRHEPLTRRSRHKLIAGVASGLGDRFRIEPNLVRLAFVVLSFAGGAGIVLYAAGWLWLPTADTARGRGAADARTDWVQVLALGGVTLGVLLLAQSTGIGAPSGLVWPIVLAAMGTALIVGRSGRPIDELIGELVQRERGAGTTAPDRTAVARVAIGGALVVAGAGAFLAAQGAFRAAGQGLVAIAVVLGGLGLIFGPWLWRLWSALVAERTERIRADERAEMAAHLHDSVLQTLALIQRRADDSGAVVGLARRQERELRSWLFGRAATQHGLDLGDAIEAAAADVEERLGVPVETVHVGTRCPVDERLEAMVLAAREAMTNAARHSGAPVIAVYEEVEPDTVTVFVRDRGCGFDSRSVAKDRGGIAESITGRMLRNGGSAAIHSRPGQGTEVQLSMRRSRP